MAALKVEHSLNTAQRKQVHDDLTGIRGELRELRQVIGALVDVLELNLQNGDSPTLPHEAPVETAENEANAKAD